MTEQDRVRRTPNDLRNEIVQRHRTKLSVDQFHAVAIIDEGATHTEQAEGRQLLLGDAASDCRMGDVHQKDIQISDSRPLLIFVCHGVVKG
ncbi:hypothetical protein TomTYG75_27210 [Sphingobium sp. TomTYG75]